MCFLTALINNQLTFYRLKMFEANICACYACLCMFNVVDNTVKKAQIGVLSTKKSLHSLCVREGINFMKWKKISAYSQEMTKVKKLKLFSSNEIF